MVKIQDSVFNLMAICYFRYLNQTNVFFHQLTRNKTYDNTSWGHVLYKSRTSNCSVWLRTILCSVNEQITCSRHIINYLIMGLLTRIKVLLTFYHLYMHNSDDILPKYWHIFKIQMPLDYFHDYSRILIKKADVPTYGIVWLKAWQLRWYYFWRRLLIPIHSTLRVWYDISNFPSILLPPSLLY